MIHAHVTLLLPIALIAALAAPAAAQPSGFTLDLETVATGLSSPVGVTHAGDGSGRLFIVSQQGRILIHDGGGVLVTPFLDISGLVSCCGERGLLGLAFHPNYAANGLFFVNYTNAVGTTVVARYQVSAGDPNVADSASAAVVLTQSQPAANHNGGQLAFGPDGLLYIAVGDGGPDVNGQNLGTWLGKILRIDVSSLPYTIPPGNPFVGNPNVPGEIWAYGLRNPWRFSFDRVKGDLLIADVGQNSWEEINFQAAGSPGGQNYGWRLMEGSACYNPPSGCNDGSLTLPILEYSHALGCSVTGGYRYRGQRFPSMDGVYFYSDYCTGRIWGAVPTAGVWAEVELLDSPLNVTSFGEDEGGELYLVGNGGLYRLVDLDTLFADGFESGDVAAWSVTVP